MTISEFSNIANSKLLDKIIDFIWCVFIILFSLFFLIKFFKLFSLPLSQTNWLFLVWICTIFVSLMLLAFYGLVILIMPLKVNYLENKMPKNQNLKLIEEVYFVLKGKDFQVDGNIVHFTFKQSFWSYKQRINFFVDDNLIAIYVKIIDSNPNGGFLDFGARSRLQKKVINIIDNIASQSLEFSTI